MKKKPIIILTGPTAVGKTELSIGLAKAVHGEIISADSMQVYKGLDIGTAKITKKEMDGVPHHLVDILTVDRPFNVSIFQKLAKEAVQEIYENGHIPVIVGGTAFYIQALLYNIDFTEENHDSSFRLRCQKIAETEEGQIALHEELEKTDPVYAAETHYHNAKRVIRALEYHKYTGKLFSEYNREQKNREADYNFRYFVLNDDRDVLYERINRRVDEMVKNGLLEEVRQLYDRHLPRSCTSMQGVGYREFFEYFDGNCDLETAVEAVKQNTRHFAKRQLTWFRKEPGVIWIDCEKYHHDRNAILKDLIRLSEEILTD